MHLLLLLRLLRHWLRLTLSHLLLHLGRDLVSRGLGLADRLLLPTLRSHGLLLLLLRWKLGHLLGTLLLLRLGQLALFDVSKTLACILEG